MANPPLSPRTQNPILATLLNHALANGVGYALAQGINFLLQLWLLRVLGDGVFGEIGIAQTCIFSVIFIAEFGIPSYFIRHIHLGKSWGKLWQRACQLRMGLTALLTLLTLLFFTLYYPEQTLGVQYVLAAFPAMLFAASTPIAVLIGQGKNTLPAAGLLLLWLMCALMTVLAYYVVPRPWLGAGLGAALSLAYGAQYLFLRLRITPDAASVSPTREETAHMRKQARIIWIPALVGTLYSLALPFIVEATHREMLPYFLIGSQLMQGVSGLNNQLQRLLLPLFLGDSVHDKASGATLKNRFFSVFSQLVLAPIWGVLVVLFVVNLVRPNAEVANDSLYFCMMAVEWVMTILGTFLITVLIAEHREDFIFRITVRSFLLSGVVQCVCVALTGSLLLVLGLRLLTSFVQIELSQRASGIAFSRTVLLSMAAMIGAGLLANSPTHFMLLAAISGLISCGLLASAAWHYRRLVREG